MDLQRSWRCFVDSRFCPPSHPSCFLRNAWCSQLSGFLSLFPGFSPSWQCLFPYNYLKHVVGFLWICWDSSHQTKAPSTDPHKSFLYLGPPGPVSSVPSGIYEVLAGHLMVPPGSVFVLRPHLNLTVSQGLGKRRALSSNPVGPGSFIFAPNRT